MRQTSVIRPSTTLRNVVALLAVAIISACSKQQPPSQEQTQAKQPLVTPEAIDAASPATQMVTGSIDAAGIPATYLASFSGDQLERIEEVRSGNDARRGAYRFRGARLLEYSGASLQGEGNLEFDLDLQGAVIAARSTPQAVQPEQLNEQISAVRTRAQLLRSHALTQRSVSSHRVQ